MNRRELKDLTRGLLESQGCTDVELYVSVGKAGLEQLMVWKRDGKNYRRVHYMTGLPTVKERGLHLYKALALVDDEMEGTRTPDYKLWKLNKHQIEKLKEAS